MGAYWTVLCIISYLVGMYLGSKLNTNEKIKTEKIKIKNQKVLVIKPRTFATGEQIQKLNEIKPNINGAVIIPNYCDYEFGEIERIVIEGDNNGK